MNLFTGHSFSPVYADILSAFSDTANILSSRIGPYRDLGPSVLELAAGSSRWTNLALRAINPFFALYEISWILSGSDRLEGLTYFIRDYGKFSDDGRSLAGAYGHRLRGKFGLDQLELAVDILGRDPDSRRVCLQLWSVEDLGRESRDIPCNLLVNLKIRDGRLDCSVANRSNDAYLGVPYNVLQFNAVQEYAGFKLGLRSGRQVHFIDSLHLYEVNRERAARIVASVKASGLVGGAGALAASSLEEYVQLNHSVLTTNYAELDGGENQFLRVRDSYIMWKAGRCDEAVHHLPATEVGLVAANWYTEIGKYSVDALPQWAQPGA